MLANDRSLRRGAVMALLAALLQAAVAVALVGAAALVLNATASEMNRAADGLALASAAGVAAIGLWLVWRKGRGADRRAEAQFRTQPGAGLGPPAYAGVAWQRAGADACRRRPSAPGRRRPRAGRTTAASCPTPRRSPARCPGADAAGTVIAAGARPCSGAILVLVFALTQGVFAAGVAATFAMALGIGGHHRRARLDGGVRQVGGDALCGGEDSRAALVARGLEFAAALAVLAFGIALMVGAGGGA